MTAGARLIMKSIATLVIALISVTSSPSKAATKGIEIWFGPRTWDVKPARDGLEYAVHDFPALIAPGAPWQTAKSRIATFSLPGNVVWSYPRKSDLVDFVQRNRFKIALGSAMLFDGDTCRRAVEGVSGDLDYNHETVGIAKLWSEAGGRLDYISMDSPEFMGHENPDGCRWTTREVVHRIAATLRGVLHYFPNIKIVDADGPGSRPTKVWLRETGEFLTEFKRQTNHSIDAFVMDLHWNDPRQRDSWADAARQATIFFHQHSMKCGLFINMDGTRKTTGQTWMKQSRLHIDWVSKAGIGLDFIAIEAWGLVPKNNLPETDDSAFSSLINYAYERFNTPDDLHRSIAR